MHKIKPLLRRFTALATQNRATWRRKMLHHDLAKGSFRIDSDLRKTLRMAPQEEHRLIANMLEVLSGITAKKQERKEEKRKE